MEAFIQGVSVWGTGLPGWPASQPVLAGVQAFVANEASPPPSALLSATERRRTGVAARLALIIAQHASEMAGIAPGAIPSVFATSNGDGAVVHTILEALAVGSAGVTDAVPQLRAQYGGWLLVDRNRIAAGHHLPRVP